MLENDLVTIYVPTYRREDVFESCLNTYLRQTHKNIRIKVFDNSLAEGFSEIKELLDRKKDSRIEYFPNNTNLGAAGNYLSIFRSISRDEKVIVVSSDMGLAEEAVENMLRAMVSSQASVVMPQYLQFQYDIKDDSGLPTFVQNPVEVNGIIESDKLMAGSEVLKFYFGAENIASDFFAFSFAGALIDGGIIYSDYRPRAGYCFHGFEQLISMEILVNSSMIYLLESRYLLCFMGQERIGGTERPINYLTRFEPIVAAEQFLKENECVLLNLGFNMLTLRKFQLKKLCYFVLNYGGFEAEISKLIFSNVKFILLHYFGLLLFPVMRFGRPLLAFVRSLLKKVK